MFPYILCYCGCALGHIYDVFLVIKRERLAEEFGDSVFDPTMIAIVGIHVDLGDILDDLQIHNDCCRVRIMQQVEFKEVY